MKLFNKLLLIFILGISFSGCSDFFEDDIEYIDDNLVIGAREGSRGIIDDIYNDYEFRYFTDFGVEYLTDNGVNNSTETDLASGNWGPTDNPYNYVWQQSYNNIRQIYQYINLVHDVGLPLYINPNSQDENDRIIARYYGEAHFLKAWAEWELLKVFGGPSISGEMLGFPIVNGILENEAYASLSRNTYQECVDQIMADLDVAITNLPLDYTSSLPGYSEIETGRASGTAAYALKAKVALFAASPAFNTTNDITKWIDAAEKLHDVIEITGGLKPLQNFNFANPDNSDHIWRMRSSVNSNVLENRLFPPSLYGQGEVNPSQNLVDAFPTSNGYPINTSESLYDASNPYTSRDNRFYRFIYYNNDQCYTSESCNNFAPLEIYQGGQDNFGGFARAEGTRTGYYLKKFLNNLNFDPAALNPVTSLPKVYVQLGLTDVYLSYAEALNEAYGAPDLIPTGFNYSAKEVMTRIRQRAGFSTDPYLDQVALNSDTFKDFVKNERRIELCFTGERFHDLRRWMAITNTENIEGVSITRNSDDTFTYNISDVETRQYEAKNYYLPLPYSEILINSNLEQNQGW